MHLVCRQCTTRLSAEVSPAPFSTRNETMEEALLQPGNLMQAERSYWFDSHVGSYLINLADARHMRLTSELSRLYGCCGVGDNGRPNLRCERCDTYVATQTEECCTPHYIVFDPGTTDVVGSEESSADPLP